MFRTIILLSIAGAASVRGDAGFDCAKYQTECVDTEITDAYENCDATNAANVDGMSCRIEHLGLIEAGDDATRDLHCSHAAPVAEGPCAEENPLVLPETACDAAAGCTDEADADGDVGGWCSWIQCGDSYDTRATGADADFCHAEKGNCEGVCAQGEGAGATWCTESTATPGSWCSWAECADSYDTRATHDGVDFCHASKDNCEGACSEGQVAGGKYCSETTNAGGCPSMCMSEEAAECDKECTPCLSGLSTTSGKDCSTCASCAVYGVCVSCDEDSYTDALFESAFIAALKGLGLSVTQITAFAETVEALPEDSQLEKLLEAAGEKAFGETDTPPTLEAATAAMNSFFASAEFRTELQRQKTFFFDKGNADLLAAVSTASETASENANENANADGASAAGHVALNLAVVAMAAAVLF